MNMSLATSTPALSYAVASMYVVARPWHNGLWYWGCWRSPVKEKSSGLEGEKTGWCQPVRTQAHWPAVAVQKSWITQHLAALWGYLYGSFWGVARKKKSLHQSWQGTALVLAGIELFFFLIAGIVLPFGFSIRIILTTDWCFNCC